MSDLWSDHLLLLFFRNVLWLILHRNLIVPTVWCYTLLILFPLLYAVWNGSVHSSQVRDSWVQISAGCTTKMTSHTGLPLLLLDGLLTVRFNWMALPLWPADTCNFWGRFSFPWLIWKFSCLNSTLDTAPWSSLAPLLIDPYCLSLPFVAMPCCFCSLWSMLCGTEVSTLHKYVIPGSTSPPAVPQRWFPTPIYYFFSFSLLIMMSKTPLATLSLCRHILLHCQPILHLFSQMPRHLMKISPLA